MANILVVDDEPDLIMVITDILNSAGHDVIESGSGYEALEKLKRVKPDLILLDVMMPAMDGWETLSLIRENDGLQGIPVAMLTAKPLTQEAIEKNNFEGLVDYIEKPFSREDLLRKININIIEGLEIIEDTKADLKSKGGDENVITEYESSAKLEMLHANVALNLKEILEEIDKPIDRGDLRSAVESQERAAELFKKKRMDILRDFL
jgi:CheY-like chemotaxis protein